MEKSSWYYWWSILSAGQLSEYKKAAWGEKSSTVLLNCEPENYANNWGGKTLGIISDAALGLNWRSMLLEKAHAWYWKPCREPMFGEFPHSWGEPATIILQNGCSIKLPSKFLSPYIIRELSSYCGWWLMQILTVGKSPDSKCHCRHIHKRNISVTPLLWA